MKERMKQILVVMVGMASIIGCAMGININAKQYTRKQLDMKQVAVLEKQKKWQAAIELVEAYLLANEQDAKAREKQAELYLELGNEQKAVSILDELIANDFGQKNYFILRSRAYYSMERDELALKDAEEAIALGDDTGEAYLIKAKVLQKRARYEEALDCYNQIVDPAAYLGEIQYGRGECLYELGHEIEAEIFFEKAYRLEPDCIDYYNGVMKACFARGYYKKICDISSEYSWRNKRYGNAYCYKGMAAYKLGRYLEAVDDFTKAIDCCEYTADIYYNRCKVYLQLDEKDKAYNDLMKSAKEDPEYVVSFDSQELKMLEGYKEYDTTIGLLLSKMN